MDFIPPFTRGEGLVRFVRGTIRRGKDFMLANEGPPGAGKSTTGYNLAGALDPNFSIREGTIKDIDHLLQVLHEAQIGDVYVLDEAVNILHNQDWNTWEAKQLSKLVRQNRVMRGCWIINLPDFDALHPYFRESRIPCRIYHPPVYDADGMSNGPSQVFWKHEWFSFKEQRVVHRWQCVIDELHVPSLDQHTDWRGYESDKRSNFRDLVSIMIERRRAEAAKEAKALKGAAKRPTKTKSRPKAEADDSPPLLRRGGNPAEVVA